MLKTIVTWVLVADATHARMLISEDPGDGLRQLPDSVLSAETVLQHSDDEGRTMNRWGGMRSRMDKHTETLPETEQFARMLVRHLDKAQRQGRFDRLVICAAPAMLGLIRRMIEVESKGTLKNTLRGEIAKNLVNVPTHDLAEHLAAVVPIEQNTA